MFTNPLTQLAQSQAPFLTMYGEERLELGGKVVVNWLNKLVNYYLHELCLEPGQTIILDLPRHWRTFLWLQAGWLAGLNMRVLDCETEENNLEAMDFWDKHPEISVIVTTVPEKYQFAFLAGCEVVALELASLSLRYRGDLPDFALDGNANVLAQPDALEAEVIFPIQAEVIVENKRLQTVEVDLDGECIGKPQPVALVNAKWTAMANRRVALDLVNHKWDIEELSLILLKLWECSASVVLIQAINGIEELLKAEKVNLCLQKI